LFKIEDFDIKLDTDYIGRNFIYSDEVESTNSMLLASKDSNQNGTVLLAEFQSKGRGRKEREWVSSSGQNLTFSILLKGEFKEQKINLINFSAAIAVAQAIENLYQLDVELKWPNDVLIHKKKIAGILLESVSKANKISRVVVGIGINVNQPNFPGQFEIHSIASREKLLSEVLNNFEELLEISKKSGKKVLADWRNRCKMLGERIKIVDGDLVKVGIFEDIDENGFLILRNGEKIEKIHFGDVSLR
jgi:BirA family biotin operon repressor/biotin-[acetyl-CoA-carboxylase] ligase